MKTNCALSDSRITRIWVIRAGKGGEAHDLFLENGIVALADAELGELTKSYKSRGAVIAAYRKKHPEDTRRGSAAIGGKYFRFAFEVSVGDIIVYPALRDKTVYVGTVLSEYKFDESLPYPHKRILKWEFMIPKSDLSQVSRYELGAARTFFEFKNNAKELLERIGSKKPCVFNRS